MVSICTAVVLIVMSISASFMLIDVRNTEQQTIKNQLMDRARYVNDQIVQNFPPGQWVDEFEQLRRLPTEAHYIQEVILSGIGTPIAPFEFGNHQFTDQAVIAAIGGELGFSIGTRGPDFNDIEQEWIAFAMPVERDGISYIIYTRISARPMNDRLAQLTGSLVMMVLMALIITVILWYLFASTISEPIVALTRHAKEMSHGNLNKELKVHSQDEIGQLSASFNHMAKGLNAMVSTLALEKSKHEAVLHNMADGVLAYDAMGNITHANTAAGILLQFDDLDQQPLNEMLMRLGFDQEEVMSLASDGVLESTITASDRHIAASCTPYTHQQGAVDGFVIVLQDITKHARLDNMRREFVANVSHELRTPLASISSYTETLLGGALDEPETAEEFLRVIEAEAKRMSLLVTDLLELSRLDDNPADMELEVVDLVGLTKMAVKQCLIAAQEKNQTILFEEPNKPYFVEASPSRINQVLINILSNSIKYSPKETDIEVNLEETENSYRLLMKDNGMGIAKEDLTRIFERFYRVDKARSRALGGTGLGLAIAKEIMEVHGGRITATSEPDVGTTMVLRFNKFDV